MEIKFYNAHIPAPQFPSASPARTNIADMPVA
jgi:hypothetical protein